MELSLTPAAEKFVRRMIRFCGAGEQAGFRLMVSAGGCSGLASEFTVEASPEQPPALTVRRKPAFSPAPPKRTMRRTNFSAAGVRVSSIIPS